MATCCRLCAFLSSHVVCGHLRSARKALPQAACGWDVVRGTGAGEALFPRASVRRLHVVAGLVLRDPAGGVLRLIRPIGRVLLRPIST